jgi:DNA-binding NarL/FixJ family response regulator
MSNPNRLRLLIAENVTILRDSFALYFSLQDNLEVVGQAADPDQARTLCQQLKPDVILVDFEPNLTDLPAFIRALHQENPATKIVVLANSLDGIEPKVLEAGATKYATRSLVASEVTEVLWQAYRE